MVAYNFSEYLAMELNEETVNAVKDEVKRLGFRDIKDDTKKRFKVLVKGNRNDARDKLLDGLASKFGAKLDMTRPGISSLGIITMPHAEVVIKAADRQGTGSAGLGNEIYIINTLNKAIADNEGKPMKIIFKAGSKTITCLDVTSVTEMGRDTAGGKKADIVLEGKKKYPISLKQDNAGAWQSSDKLLGGPAGDIVRELVKAGKVELQDLRGYPGLKRITPEIAVPLSRKLQDATVFGSDLKPNGGVVVRTFKADDFKISFDESTIIVESSAIIKSLRDVINTDKEPIAIIRNDRSRGSARIGIKGLRVLVNQKSRVSRKTFMVRDKTLG